MPSISPDRGARISGPTRPTCWPPSPTTISRSGWRGDSLYLGEVSLPPDFDVSQARPEVHRTLAQWQAMGVRRPGGAPLGAPETVASIVRPGGDNGPNLLVTENYRAIMRYNSSLYYATAVTYFSEQIRQ